MTPTEATNLLIMFTVPVLTARMIVGLSYEHRTHVIWTFALPTFAFLVLVARLTITRNFYDLIEEHANDPSSWLVPLTWAFVVATQLGATLYSWWPTWNKAVERAKNGHG